MPKMTKDEFEQGYAKRSNLTVEALRALGGHVEPCECDYEGCKGLQMKFSERHNLNA